MLSLFGRSVATLDCYEFLQHFPCIVFPAIEGGVSRIVGWKFCKSSRIGPRSWTVHDLSKRESCPNGSNEFIEGCNNCLNLHLFKLSLIPVIKRKTQTTCCQQ
jgi:hypothetical protein